MSMNIKTDFHKRLSNVIQTAGTLSPFQVRGSVQPIIDFKTISDLVKTYTIPSTAGNVDVTINVPKNKAWEILYGAINIVNDATAANRTLQWTIRDDENNVLYKSGTHQSDATASQNKYAMIRGSEGIPNSTDAYKLGTTLGEIAVPPTVWNPDHIYIELNSGVAGDSYSGLIKYKERYTPVET
jgi:hypothetical protein